MQKTSVKSSKIDIFTIFTRKTNGFFKTFLRFLHFGTRILSKSASFLTILVKKRNVFLMFFCIFLKQRQGFSLTMQLILATNEF